MLKDWNNNLHRPLGLQQRRKKEEHRQVPMNGEDCNPHNEPTYRSDDDILLQQESQLNGSPARPTTSGRGVHPQPCTLAYHDAQEDDDIHEIIEVYRRRSWTACMGSEEELLMASCTENWLLEWFDSLAVNVCWNRKSI